MYVGTVLSVVWLDYMRHKLIICDPLSEIPACRAFYENRDKTGNRYTKCVIVLQQKNGSDWLLGSGATERNA